MGKRGLEPCVVQALKDAAVVLWLTGIGWLLLATLESQVAWGDEFPTELGAGMLLMQSASSFDPAAPLATDVRISIAGVVARVTVAQRFRNTGASPVEAVYAFPLPDDAAVDRLSMRIGERVIEGEIREREQAERIYNQARDAGQRASLLTQATPNLFTTAVANIGPGETIDITIEYLQTARYDGGEFSLRFPMTLTPRYGEGDTPEQLSAAAATVDPAATTNEATLRVILAPGLPLADVGSRHHQVRVVRDDDHYAIETLAPRVPMDRDFVVAWRPEVGSTPAVAALTETLGDTTYALFMIVPPADAYAYRSQPRELIYVIDTSGSMAGQSIEQAKAALKDALGRLTGADRFNVIEFNSTTSSLYATPMPLTRASYAEAQSYVEELVADGGTEMEPAIRDALTQPAAPGYLRQVIFLTDAGVANETELFTAIKQDLGQARLFTIGIGAAPNSYFMRKAAQFGRGTYTHIGDTAAVAGAMHALFEKLERVALTDVLVDWPDAVELYPHQAPDLYGGEPIVMAASFPAQGDRPLSVEAFGRADGAQWSQRVTAQASTLPGIATLWARRKIEYAIDSRVAGVNEDLIRKIVVDVALEHGLVSPYTSLVAVDKTPAQSFAGALERKTVGNMVPAGAVWGGLPQTATAAPLLRLLGLLLLLLAAEVLVLRARQRKLAQ
jgi:Ca-activated chloride channel family protein